jgi:hypothetical protein
MKLVDGLKVVTPHTKISESSETDVRDVFHQCVAAVQIYMMDNLHRRTLTPHSLVFLILTLTCSVHLPSAESDRRFTD